MTNPTARQVNFKSKAEREHMCECLARARAARELPPLPPPPASRLAEMCERWCKGLLSNFDYLMFLNDCSGRSLHDLTQYPVLPWVIADYKSATLDLANPATYRASGRSRTAASAACRGPPVVRLQGPSRGARRAV